MEGWLAYSLLAFILWGIWGFLGKLAASSLPARQLVVFALLGYVVVFPLIILASIKNLKGAAFGKGAWIAVLAGLFSGAAYVSYYHALSRGEASRVVVVTALYPIITCVLSFILLREPLSLQKALGILFALAGIIFLSS